MTEAQYSQPNQEAPCLQPNPKGAILAISIPRPPPEIRTRRARLRVPLHKRGRPGRVPGARHLPSTQFNFIGHRSLTVAARFGAGGALPWLGPGRFGGRWRGRLAGRYPGGALRPAAQPRNPTLARHQLKQIEKNRQSQKPRPQVHHRLPCLPRPKHALRLRIKFATRPSGNLPQ